MAAMRVGTSKSVAMVQCQKTGECSLFVLGGRLLRMRGFKNQESSWLNGKVEPELNRWIVSIIIILHPFSYADPFQGRSGAGACHSY